MRFQHLKLSDSLLRAVEEAGYSEPTPIQAQAIPHVLTGQDLIGCAQTGTGKTAAFVLPILQQLHKRRNPKSQGKRRPIRALIVTPTRELAAQIGDNINTYARYLPLKHTVIFGGVSQNPQVDRLKKGVDVLVATPGRLLDLMNQGHIRLNQIEIFVLDEADRMLDMGFIHDMRRIIKVLPKQRQTLLFSATMPFAIQTLANQILKSPRMVEVTPQSTTVEKIDQSVYFVGKKQKTNLLIHILSDDPSILRVLVFTRTKHGANRLVKKLDQANIHGEAIHGNKSQGARERALENFKQGRTRVLVATDIASRGIDVDDVTHVINFDLPSEPESYVHRIGRTARAGASGVAYSFCDADERKYLSRIERLIKRRVPVAEDYTKTAIPTEHLPVRNPQQQTQSRNNGNRNNKSRNQSKNGANNDKSSRNKRRRRRSNRPRQPLEE